MQVIVELLENYRSMRHEIYCRRVRASTLQKVVLATGMAVLTGLLAQVKVPLPWSPVPITGQTFSVLLAGVLLGNTWAGISMGIYIILGIAGVPWFTGWGSGLSYLAGPTGGYLWGFILAALFIGYMADRFVRARRFTSMFVLMITANFVLIYGPGLGQLYLWFTLVKGNPVDFTGLLYMGMLPFITGDIVKATLAAGLGRILMPKEAFNKETDAGNSGNSRLP